MLKMFTIDWTTPLPFGRAQRCHHRCACGAVLVCGDADRCPVLTNDWQCDACTLDAADAYFDRLEREKQERGQ